MAKREEETADPKSLSLADLVEALKAATGNDDETMRRRAQFEAEAYERLEEKENTTHPGVSAFSHHEGDKRHPKPPLKCEMFWVGYPLEVEGLTPTEVDLLNTAEAGAFIFHKTDGSQDKLTVTPTIGSTGKLERLEFGFPCRGDNKHNLPTMVQLLRETQGTPSREQELLAEIARLRSAMAGSPA